MTSVEKKAMNFSKSFMYSVHQMYFLVQKHLEKILLEKKLLSFSQFLILVCFLDCNKKEENSQSDVAKFLYLTEATVSRHMDRLKKLKLIDKKTDTTNRRKQVITVTKYGLSEFSKTKNVIEKELDNIFNIIPTKSRKNIISNFELVLKKLKK